MFGRNWRAHDAEAANPNVARFLRRFEGDVMLQRDRKAKWWTASLHQDGEIMAVGEGSTDFAAVQQAAKKIGYKP